MKTLAKNYGISMIDYNGDRLEYIEDYAKAYMILVEDPTIFPNIPKELMMCESEIFEGMTMPIFDMEDDSIRLVNLNERSTIVFVCTFDMEYEELYWRDITFDYNLICKLFNSLLFGIEKTRRRCKSICLR